MLPIFYIQSSMFQIQLRHKGQNKKITAGESPAPPQLRKLISECFGLRQKVIGVTDKNGKFLQLSQLDQQLIKNNTWGFSLVTAKDVNEDNMSFASESHPKQGFAIQDSTLPSLAIPASISSCQGVVKDLQLFEELMLSQGKITIVACCGSTKPTSDTPYPYYLYSSEQKQSVVVYSGTSKVCQFYVADWKHPNPQIGTFIQGLIQPQSQVASFQKQAQHQKGYNIQQEQQQQQNEPDNNNAYNQEIKQELLEKFTRLFEEQELTQLEFYRLKSQLLQNPQDFVRKYQMGTRQGFRGGSRNQQRSVPSGIEQRSVPSRNQQRNVASRNQQRESTKEEKREQQREIQDRRRQMEGRRQRGRSGNKGKRYQIPIIVRKYNNVVEKISTSYPLTLEQQQAINLILELQLKGLITEKQAGQFKSLVLQQDQQTFRLFQDYFQDILDQIELAARLRKKRGINGRQDSGERAQHDMRLLIKFAKRTQYQKLRKLALEGNRHVVQALDNYRRSKNGQAFAGQLQKISGYYKAKEVLEQLQSR